MNKFQRNWMVYRELHRLARDCMNRSPIGTYLILDQRTIKKYQSMSEQEYLDYQGKLSYRLKK
jgi:hypothetical protein